MQAVTPLRPKTALVEDQICASCSKSSAKMSQCSRCHFERYCGSECQKAQWPHHKPVCLLMKKREDFWTGFNKLHAEEFDTRAKRKPDGTYTGDGGALTYSELFHKACNLVPRGADAKKALDIGCGDGDISIDLLEKGWTVVALDAKENAIAALMHKATIANPLWIANKKLSAIECKAENYDFPDRCHLIVIKDVLPFCQPKKLRTILDKIHRALVDDGGILLGSFFQFGNGFGAQKNWRSWGAWFIKDEQTVRDLLEASFYEVIECRRRPKAGSTSDVIEFCARKKPIYPAAKPPQDGQ